MNHQHLFDLFALKKATPEQILYLGKKLKELWSTKLAHDFPGKAFTVEFDESFDFQTDNPEITFYQSYSNLIIKE